MKRLAKRLLPGHQLDLVGLYARQFVFHLPMKKDLLIDCREARPNMPPMDYLLLLDLIEDPLILFLLLHVGFELATLGLHPLVQEFQLLDFSLKLSHFEQSLVRFKFKFIYINKHSK